MTYLFVVVTILMMTSLYWGCSSTEISSRSPDDRAVPLPSLPPAPQLPAGWRIVLASDSSSGVQRTIMASDSSAVMLLRQLFVMKEARTTLDAERICAIGQLSLQRTMAAGAPLRRVLRMPEFLGQKNEYCSYVFEDGALLRRILIFRTGGKYYELELRQLRPGPSLGRMAGDQLQAAQILPDLP